MIKAIESTSSYWKKKKGNPFSIVPKLTVAQINQ
jgi:hypothetical protein